MLASYGALAAWIRGVTESSLSLLWLLVLSVLGTVMGASAATGVLNTRN